MKADLNPANYAAIIESIPEDERVEFLLYAIELIRGESEDHIVDVACERLTASERRLLIYLYDKSPRLCTYDNIMNHCWAHKIAQDEVPEHAVVKVMVSHMRKKIPDHWKINPVRGLGYYLEIT